MLREKCGSSDEFCFCLLYEHNALENFHWTGENSGFWSGTFCNLKFTEIIECKKNSINYELK